MKRFHWWHGVLFFAGVQAASWGLRKLVKGEPDIYKRERLPVFAPPPAALPIAWTINSVAAIAGGLHVLNLGPETPGRTGYIRLQGSAWILFSSFNAAYFGLGSPLNAAGITLVYAALTGASIDVASRAMRDRVAALSLAPTAAWLALAVPLGIAQALWNRDHFWNAGPFVEPDPAWLKRESV